MNKVNNRFGGRPKTSFILNLNHVDNTIEELSDVIDPNKKQRLDGSQVKTEIIYSETK